MQREIKFRIYDPVEKRMDYSPETFTGWLNDNFVFDGYADGEEPVVMQFTGLTDKNGKEIYEGDILKHETGGLSSIEYEAPHFILRHHPEGGSDFPAPKNFFEVIGNIYENPELLK